MAVLKRINSDYQAFEFITNSRRDLQLWGGLLSWTDEVNPGVVEHQILKRAGALHQVFSPKPRVHTFKCTMIGERVGERYRALCAAIEEDPTGRLVHPRFGSVAAVCLSVQGAEDPGESVDEVMFTIRFAETGLRTQPRESAGSIAAGALGLAKSYEARGVSIAAYAAALRIVVANLTTLISSLVTARSSVELNRQLRDAAEKTAAAQAEATRQDRYDLYADAALVYARCIEAVNAAGEGRPPIIERPVEGDTDLPRLCAALYGGRWARAMLDEILSLNRVPNPARVLAGTRLLLPDPEHVTGRRSDDGR